MPKALLDFLGYSFFFWSREDGEPPHIHVCKGKPKENAAKFWITSRGIVTWLDGDVDCAPEFMYKNSFEYSALEVG